MLYNLDRQGNRVIIDASHGGEDNGATYNGDLEKNLSLEISNYMYNRLKELGVPVSITRDYDYTLNDGDRVDKILDFYGNSPDVILISNHVDSDIDEAQIIYALRNDNELSNLIFNEFNNIGLDVKEPFQRRAVNDTALDYYFIHRNTGKIEPVIIQYGSISNYNEIERNYKKYVDGVIDALIKYLNILPSDNYYIVKKGDTLYSIARKYNISLDQLKKNNNLSSNYIDVGQRLFIYNNTNTMDNLENNYIVKKGDTLYSISKLYNVNVSDLMKLNNLENNNLYIGQILKIPIVESNDIEYVVKSGDNLYKISRIYDVSVDDIMKYNNLKSNLLSIGQFLKIPTSNDESNIYIVKSGDNLYSIARRYNTTVDDIKLKNNLKSNLLSIGQKLVL